MPYIGKSPSAGVRQRYQYTATAGQTTFSGTDLGNLTLTYTDNNFVDVFQNGVLLKGGGTDYTATSGTSVVLTTGASVSDVIEIIVYDVFSVGNFFSRTDSDSRYVNVSGDTMTGALTNNAGIIVDNITIDGQEIDVSSGDLTLDVAGNIILDADSTDILLKDGGTTYGQFFKDGDNFKIVAGIQDGDIVFRGNDGGSGIDVLTIDMSTGGRVGITHGGTSGGPSYPFHVQTDNVGFASAFWNDGNDSNRQGIIIQCGKDDASGTNTPITFSDGNGDEQGKITFSSGTVSYGAFTAYHQCIVPNADNDADSQAMAYPYGTLLETTSIVYTQKNGADTERGILYNVQKTQSANSKKVLGAYGSSMNDSSSNITNMHQVLILGDGHILCNNAGGNISVGDGICSSSTAGIGQKATANPSMIIGIAQEDITFSGSETRLVAVQYGLQQFIPWS